MTTKRSPRIMVNRMEFETLKLEHAMMRQVLADASDMCEAVKSDATAAEASQIMLRLIKSVYQCRGVR